MEINKNNEKFLFLFNKFSDNLLISLKSEFTKIYNSLNIKLQNSKEKEILDDNINMENISEKLNNIEKDNIGIKKDIEWLSHILTPTIGAIILTAIIFGFTSMNNTINAYRNELNTKYDQSISNTNNKFDQINTSFKGINQRLDDQYRYIDAKTQKK